jgi:hypothetical protein
MIITNTNEVIELILSGNVVTSQASFLSAYNEISLSGMTPYETNGVSNNTTAVTIMGSPSSGNQRQLREVNIRNNDTASITLTIRYNDTTNIRTIYRVVLQPNETLLYTQDSGWYVYDTNSMKKLSTTHVYQNANLKMLDLFFGQTGTTTTLANSNYAVISLGKVDKSYTQITLNYRIFTAAVGVTFAELAIYRVAQPMGVGTTQSLYRLGFTDTSSIWTSIGSKTTSVTVSNLKKGDDLYVVLASAVSTTQPAFYSGNAADPLSSVLSGNNSAGVASRPSLNEMYQTSTVSNTVGSIYVSWQGS